MSIRRRRRPPAPLVWTAPPPCPAGWAPGPPDFVGVGAQRCGTSWWFGLIASHPQVATVPGFSKEVHFFDEQAGGLPAGASGEYARYFPRPPGAIAGEWTPRYMHDVATPRLLRRLAPEARLLVLLRDPVERYRSGVAHESAKSGAAPPVFVASDAFARGLYHQQLQRVLAHFARDQLLVLQFERCVADPVVELARTFAFLGVEPSFLPATWAGEWRNATTAPQPALGEGLGASLISAYRDDLSRLAGDFHEIDVDLWPTMVALR